MVLLESRLCQKCKIHPLVQITAVQDGITLKGKKPVSKSCHDLVMLGYRHSHIPVDVRKLINWA